MHIVGYKWKTNGEKNIFHDSWEPHLIVKGDEIERIPVFGRDLSIKLGGRFCIGHFSGGKHIKCPSQEKTTHGWYCDFCRKADDFFSCIQCNGECLNHRQREGCRASTYFIYLAVFDSLLKVGISQEHRIFERLIEQGADFAAKVAFIKDGMVVRKIEQDIKKSLRCVDRIRGNEKHSRLFSDPNIAVLTITKSLATLKERFDMNVLEIYDLRKFYRLENVARRPRMITVRDDLDIRGKVIAAKGNILVIKNGFYYSLNAHDLIGREAEIAVN